MKFTPTLLEAFMSRHLLLRLTLAATLLSLSPVLAEPPPAEGKPAEVRLDWATYNPASVVLKKFGWLEEELGKDGIRVTWLYSAGSNKANESIASGSADLASTAGAAALLARSNGVPLKTVYVYSKPEWTALVVPEGSSLWSVSQLKGKKIAATRGTDPFFFLLRSLNEAGLSKSEVEIVNLQHADGRLALERGNVDAWAGLDPHMAAAELRSGARLLYRNVDFNTFGTLNAREDFVKKFPATVLRVEWQYEKARRWILAHPDEAAAVLAEAGKIDVDVARKQLERAGLNVSGFDLKPVLRALQSVLPLLTGEKLVASDADPAKALDELFVSDPRRSGFFHPVSTGPVGNR
jgi:sulfonate transport system substrate-binding protein